MHGGFDDGCSPSSRGRPRSDICGPIDGPWANESAPNSYCLQGRVWGYPGNCQFSSYAQCMATAYGTDAYCGMNPHYAFALQRRGDYRADTERQ